MDVHQNYETRSRKKKLTRENNYAQKLRNKTQNRKKRLSRKYNDWYLLKIIKKLTRETMLDIHKIRNNTKAEITHKEERKTLTRDRGML